MEGRPLLRLLPGLDWRDLELRIEKGDEPLEQVCEEAAGLLCDAVLEAGRHADSWRLGLRAALTELLHVLGDQPQLARALLIDVHAVRGRAWEAHRCAVARLTTALDSARSEPGALPSASPTTAGLVLGAIEESLRLELLAGRGAEVECLLPDFAHLVVLNYFGEDEAWLELRSDGVRTPTGS